MYRKKILVEIQLGINSDKSNFIQCSNNFNHLIYELERSELGPFSELSNIWMATDPRGDFYDARGK